MKVDIIVPTYNRPNDLKKFIEEISRQIYPNLHIYIIDDNSDEDLSALIPATSFITYIRLENNKGQTYARNYALELSKGDITVFLDDDAWFFDSDAIEKIVRYFINDSNLGGIMLNVQEPGKKFLSVQRHLNDKDTIGSFIACACAFRKKALVEVGSFTDFLHSYGEETDLTLKLFAHNFTLKFAKEVKVFHNYQPGARSKEWYLRFRKNSLRNDLLIVLMRFPWYLIPPYLFVKFLSHLRYTIKNKRNLFSAVLATFSGLFSALSLTNRAFAQRHPVSLNLFKSWLMLRW